MVSGPIPFRKWGEVAALLAKYPEITTKWQKIDIPNFHRYCFRNLLAYFDTDEHAAKGLDQAELGLRLQPAPGVNLYYPNPANPRDVEVTVFGFDTLGHVMSHWDDDTRSIINETLPDHAYRDGFVVRQATLLNRAIWVTTFGEGRNSTEYKAWVNGTFGPLGFLRCDDVIRDRLTNLPAFLLTPEVMQPWMAM